MQQNCFSNKWVNLPKKSINGSFTSLTNIKTYFLVKRNSYRVVIRNMSSELHQGIFIPYVGKPEEIKINIESGDIKL